MVLIIGGAYQGKLTYAVNRYSLKSADLFDCDGETVDFSKRCIFHLERFTLHCARGGLDPVEYFKVHQEQWQNSILICRDISCGVVPMDAELRQWRQANGRLCQYLAAEAEEVIRVFCGLEQRIK